jgi:hypothetical protein
VPTQSHPAFLCQPVCFCCYLIVFRLPADGSSSAFGLCLNRLSGCERFKSRIFISDGIDGAIRFHFILGNSLFIFICWMFGVPSILFFTTLHFIHPKPHTDLRSARACLSFSLGSLPVLFIMLPTYGALDRSLRCPSTISFVFVVWWCRWSGGEVDSDGSTAGTDSVGRAREGCI